jgi:WD40 repeat protein
MNSTNMHISIWLLFMTLTGIVACADQKSTQPKVLFAFEDDLWRANVAGTQVERLTEGQVLNWGMAMDPDWWMEARSRPPQVSSDGRWIAVASSWQEIVVAAVGHQAEPQLVQPGASIIAWSPDSQFFAYVPARKPGPGTPANGRIYIYNVQSKTGRYLLEDEAQSNIINLVWSPNGRFIAYSCCFEWGTEPGSSASMGQIRRLDVTTSQSEIVGETWSSVGGGSPALCWTADNRVETVETVVAAVRCSYRGLSYQATSPDGAHRAWLQAATVEDEHWSGPSVLTVEDVATGEMLWQQQLAENVRAIIWSPDGHYLLLDDGLNTTPIWRIQTDGSSELEVVVPNGYLLEVIDAWQ